MLVYKQTKEVPITTTLVINSSDSIGDTIIELVTIIEPNLRMFLTTHIKNQKRLFQNRKKCVQGDFFKFYKLRF